MNNKDKERRLKRLYTWARDKVEYYFAKRWLDRHFGEEEFWGSYIEDLIYYKTKNERL